MQCKRFPSPSPQLHHMYIHVLQSLTKAILVMPAFRFTDQQFEPAIMGTTLSTKKMHKNESKSRYTHALAQPIQEKLQSNNALIITACHSPPMQSEDFCPELSEPTKRASLLYFPACKLFKKKINHFIC